MRLLSKMSDFLAVLSGLNERTFECPKLKFLVFFATELELDSALAALAAVSTSIRSVVDDSDRDALERAGFFWVDTL